MKSKKYIKKKCNIFIPRNVYSLFLILSHKKYVLDDDYILLNINYRYISKLHDKIILFLKKKNFKIIYIKKVHSLKKIKNSPNTFISQLLKINFFKSLNYTCNEILKVKYEEFSTINFYNYKFINIYYGSNLLYYSNLVKKFKNINLIFLEHGMGNILSSIDDQYIYYSSFKSKILNFIKNLFFRMKGVFLPSSSYYCGIYGQLFNIKKLEYNNHKTTFLNLNYKKGFNLLYNFYKDDLQKIRKNMKNNYIFLNVPIIYDDIVYKKFLNLIFDSLKFKENYVLLLKSHTRDAKLKKSNTYLKRYLRTQKISFFFIDDIYSHIPAEVIVKYFKVKEIYTSYSSILFTNFYFYNKKIKINALFSPKIKKKWKGRAEYKTYILNFIKKKYLNKYLDIVFF